MKNKFYILFWEFVDLLFPPACGGCKQPGVRWCETCQKQTKEIKPPICDICGQSITAGNLCQRCQKLTPNFTAIRSWAEFNGPIRNALHDLKYRRNIGLGISLAQHLVGLLQTCGWDINLVVPVPLGQARKQQRGYNQAALLAQPLAHALQLPYNPRILTRVRETQSQVELSLIERQKNMQGAFQAHSQKVQRQIILVIDDVTTTGSTLNACAGALLEAGAQSVYGMTVARAMLSNF